MNYLKGKEKFFTAGDESVKAIKSFGRWQGKLGKIEKFLTVPDTTRRMEIRW